MRPPDSAAELPAEERRPVIKAGAAAAALKRRGEVADSIRRELGWEKDAPMQMQAAGIANLVNYAAAPSGGQVYDSHWLASNTTARS